MASPSIRAGETLGRYQLLEQIGAGGMGVVFRARDQRLAREVAIKLLVPGSIRSVAARHRVRNEAMALSRLNHPNIETIHEFDSQGDCDYLVVELIQGKSVDALLSDGALPLTLAVSLSVQLLRGLAAAHEKGIIHRDLKPSNLRLTSDGFLKILDFGIAHVDHEPAHLNDLTTETHLSVFSGTLAYMSPEQIRGMPLDPRSDLYAVGLVMYQMCTGRLPFTESGASLVRATLNRPIPSPKKVNGEISRRLEAVILKALEKDSNQRYRSAQEMLRDLENFESVSVNSRNARQLQVVALALVGLILASWAALEHARFAEWIERQLHPMPAYKYLAVMPFRSARNDDPAFDQGLTEAVAVKLMEITASQPVQVVSPRELKAEHVTDVGDARKKLGVNLALEGSLQQAAGATRVSLELVDSATRRLLRAADLRVQAADPFAIEDQVVEKSVEMLEIEMHKSIGERGHGTTNADAFRLYTRGRGFLQNGNSPEDNESAVDQFRQALKIDPGYADAYASLGLAYLQQYGFEKHGDLVDRARSACDEASTLNSHLQLGLVCLGKVQLTTGAYEQAASTFQTAVSSDPTDDEAYRNLAVAYERLRRSSLAEETYNKAISVRPQYAVGYVRLGLFLSHQAKYREAIEQLRRAVRLSPDDPRVWSSMGGVYYLAGRYDDALLALTRAIELRPTYAAYTNLGHSYFAIGKYEDAIAAFEQALTLGQNQVQAHGNLARAYYWFLPKRGQAVGEYRKALDLIGNELKVDPNDPDTHLLAAQYSAMLSRRQDALTHLDFAIRARPSDAETLYFAAIVNNQLGDRQQAISWLQKAIQSGYSPNEIAGTPELSSLKNEPGLSALPK